MVNKLIQLTPLLVWSEFNSNWLLHTYNLESNSSQFSKQFIQSTGMKFRSPCDYNNQNEDNVFSDNDNSSFLKFKQKPASYIVINNEILLQTNKGSWMRI